MKQLTIILTALLMCSCTPPKAKTIEVLENAGFKDIKLTGWKPFAGDTLLVAVLLGRRRRRISTPKRL